MNESDKNTEKTILDAAKQVFLIKGFDGARMQEIADAAGMNKALLHYYFRSKDNLFDAIFNEAFQQFFPRIAEIMSTEKPFFEKIDLFIDTYLTMLSNNPHLPGFIMHELSRNPQRIVSMMKNSGLKPSIVLTSIQKEVEAGNIEPIDPAHLIINIIAMCLFPFIGRPIIQGLIFKDNKKAYEQFLSERKVQVKQFVMHAIMKKNKKLK